jgi:hypothetical protein
MKALLAQLACRIGDVEGNTSRAIDAIRCTKFVRPTRPVTVLEKERSPA